MKLAMISLLSALVVISSQQQFQYKARPSGLFWLSPYSPQQGFIKNDQQSAAQLFYGDEIPHRINQQWTTRPSTRIGEIITFFKNEDINPDGVFANEDPGQNSLEEIDESDEDTQGRIKFLQHQNKNTGRFFYSTTINNPFIKTATFTLSTTVTTVGSIVLCVPVNNLAAIPAPTCAGRRRRETEDTDSDQFPISPSETLKLIPTALPSLGSTLPNHRESRHHLFVNELQVDPLQGVDSSKDEGRPAGMLLEDDRSHPREKRFFGRGIAASTTVTSYSFVAATLTSTVILDPTAGGLAACLPAGYVVCPA